MKYIFLLTVVTILFNHADAQIFKKQIKRPYSQLDNIKIDEHFSIENLDTVYNILHDHYGLNIVYDTTYCNSLIFSYWYMAIAAPLAIEITTRNNDLSYTIDSTNTIYVKARHVHNIKKKPLPNTREEKNNSPLSSLNFTLYGHVVDDSTNESLAGVYVTVKGTSISAISGIDGSFTLNNVPSDTASLSVSYMGYMPADIFLTSNSSKTNFMIGLHQAEHILDEATVLANRVDLMRLSSKTISTIKLSPEKLEQIPNVGEKDIMRTFQLMPGISAANESSSGLYVRGGTPDQNLVMYDGFTVYQVDHLYGFFSAFNANAVKEVELYKGGFDAKYGGRLSSVTDITGKEGSTKQFNLGGDVSLLSANIFTEIPITENLSLVAAARRSWNGPIYNWIFNSFNKSSGSSNTTGTSGQGPGGADNTTKAKSYFYDLNTRLTFKPTKKDVFTYSMFSGGDDLNNSFTVNTPSFLASMGISLNFGTTDVTNYGNVGMSMGWQRTWNKKMTSNTVLSYSNFYSDRNRVTNGSFGEQGSTTTTKTGIFENNNLKDISLRTDHEWLLTKWNHIGFGAFGTHYDIKYTYSQNDSSLLLNNHNTSDLVGGYLQDKFIFFNDKVSVTTGMRFSYFGLTAKTYTEPRVALDYDITRKLSFKAAYGEYYQFANRITREDISAGSSEFWVLSDGKTVPVSNAAHYIAGLSYETNSYLFGVEGYYKTLNNIVQYTERYSATTSTINYTQNFYTGSGYSQGVEFMAQKKIRKFTGWVSYTLSKTMDHFAVYSAQYFPADNDVRNEFKVVSMYKMNHWDFAATWIYASGKPYTAPGGGYSVTLLDGTKENYVTITSKNTLRLPDYHRMDVSVNYHFYNEAKKDVGYVGLSLFNVYARQNVWYKEFTIVSGHVVETNVDYLSFTPNPTLSLKLR